MSSVKVLLLTLFLSLTAPARVYISVTPSVLQAGDSVRLTCTVPKNADNRWLKIGIEGYRTSIFQLDGDSAPITHTFIVQKVGCDTPLAICVVKDNLDREYPAVRELGIAGCGGHNEFEDR
jgi:hypothetical protein